MSENEEIAAQDVLADLVEADATDGLTREQAIAELAKVRREAAKHRTEKQAAKAIAEELQRYKDAEKTELEKVTERAQRAEEELAKHARERAARDAVKAAGLDSEWADLVRGDTEEELLASAKALAERVGTGAGPQPNLSAFNAAGGKPVKPAENASESFRNFLINASKN